MNTFEAPTGVDVDQYSDVMKFLEGESNKLTPTEREYWALRKELAEVGVSMLTRLHENDKAIEKKMHKIVQDATGRHNESTWEELSSTLFSDGEQKKISEGISKTKQKDPSDDSSIKLLKKRSEEIALKLKELSKRVQKEISKNSTKLEFYKGQEYYDEINKEVLDQKYLKVKHSRLSKFVILSKFNEIIPIQRDFLDSKTPQVFTQKLQQYNDMGDNSSGELLVLYYAGHINRAGVSHPTDKANAKKVATSLYSRGNAQGAAQLVFFADNDEQSIRYYFTSKRISPESSLKLSKDELQQDYPQVEIKKLELAGLM